MKDALASFKEALLQEITEILSVKYCILEAGTDSDDVELYEAWEGGHPDEGGEPMCGTTDYSSEGSKRIVRDMLRLQIYAAIGDLEYYGDYSEQRKNLPPA